MSTNAFARPNAHSVDGPVCLSEDSKPSTASAAALANEARFAVTGEDISSLATFVPVGLLALISFGAVLASH